MELGQTAPSVRKLSFTLAGSLLGGRRPCGPASWAPAGTRGRALCPRAQAGHRRGKLRCSLTGGCSATSGRSKPHCESDKPSCPPRRGRCDRPLSAGILRSDHLVTSEHVRGLQIFRQISFQKTVPAMPFLWSCHRPPCAGERVLWVSYQLRISEEH